MRPFKPVVLAIPAGTGYRGIRNLDSKYLFHHRSRLHNGPGPVAQVIFFIHTKFCHGSSQLRDEENRIIAEATAAALIRYDLPLAFSFGALNFLTRHRDGNGSAKACCPRARLAPQVFQEKRPAIGIRSAGIGRVAMGIEAGSTR